MENTEPVPAWGPDEIQRMRRRSPFLVAAFEDSQGAPLAWQELDVAVLDGDPSAVELPTSVKVTCGSAAVMWTRVGPARIDGNIAFCVAGDPEQVVDK